MKRINNLYLKITLREELKIGKYILKINLHSEHLNLKY